MTRAYQVDSVLLALRTAILDGEIPSGTPIFNGPQSGQFALPAAQAATVTSVLVAEGLVEVRRASPEHAGVAVVAALHEWSVVELFQLLWGSLRAVVPRFRKEKVAKDTIQGVKSQLRAAALKVQKPEDGPIFWGAFRESMEKLLTSLGLPETAVIVERQLRRLLLLDPHAFQYQGAMDLDSDFDGLVLQLLSDAIHPVTLRDLIETMVQHLAELWRCDTILQRLCPELLKHGSLSLPKTPGVLNLTYPPA